MTRDEAIELLHKKIVENKAVFAKWQIPEWAIQAVLEAAENEA